MTDAAADRPLGQIRDGVQVVAAALGTARRLISMPDAYIRAQSAFDRHARLGLPQQTGPEVTQAMFLQFLTTQVMDWTDDEIAALTRIIDSLRPVFAETPMMLPETVTLVKTTGREEGAAAYTRHHDTIVLPVNMVSSILAVPAGGDPLHPARSDAYLSGIVCHEFFHILSKNNPEWRRNLYALLDFDLLDTAIPLPDAPMDGGLPLADLKITNPDAPLINVTTKMIPPDGTAPVTMAPALVSTGPYVGGEFFATLDWIFVAVEDGAVAMSDGKPVWYPSKPLMPQYLKKIGRNLTGELFHPDEVLAQSFVMAAHEPSLGLLQTIAGTIWPGRAGG